MHRKTEASFSSKVACACVFGGVFVCYLVSSLRQLDQRTGGDNVVTVYRAFDPKTRDNPVKPHKPIPEAYTDFKCETASKHSNKLCSMIKPLDILGQTRFHLDAELASAMFQKCLAKRQEAAVYIPPPTYLPDYKNPCWVSAGDEAVRCLPYFYVLGVPRCATTDMYYRMQQHPQIAYVETKEVQWLTKGRYAFPRIDGISAAPSILNFSDIFANATAEIFASHDRNSYHRKIIGDFSVSTFWDNMYEAKYASIKNKTGQRNAECIHHLNPDAKFVLPIRDPVTRAYSDYLFFDMNSVKTRAIFHEFVEAGIRTHYECLEYQPLQYCIDYRPNNKGKSGRLFIGLYHQHFQEYFQFFERNQFFIFKLEDYAQNVPGYLKKIYDFLGLDEASDDAYHAMMNVTWTENKVTEEALALGDMLPETRLLLEDFYRPYNDLLGQLIGEQFNYNSGYSSDYNSEYTDDYSNDEYDEYLNT